MYSIILLLIYLTINTDLFRIFVFIIKNGGEVVSELNDNKRELAKILWSESDEKLRQKGFLKEIAKQLKVTQNQIYKWKKADNWEQNKNNSLYENLKYKNASKEELAFLTDLDIDEIKELKRTIRECDLCIINYEKIKHTLNNDDAALIKYDSEIEKRIKIKIRCIENLLKIEKSSKNDDFKINVKLV